MTPTTQPAIRIRTLPFAALAALVIVRGLMAGPALADEGMWLPPQMPALGDRLKSIGFKGDPNAFSELTGHPMGAIIQIPGCSASFVSAEGLVVTNHHCVVEALQHNSTPERNLLEKGFLARSRDEELWAGPGSRVLVTVSVAEVTDVIRGKLDPKLSDRARRDLLDRRVKERTKACEASGLRCRVAPYFEGLRYFETAQLEIQDVRLVYAPAEGIGVFGGETDNWQWPRHTGDWSFYRAYVSKDGKGVPFDKSNIPYRPKHHLQVSPLGASPGDVVFVAGYPGKTQRLIPYGDLKEIVDWQLPRGRRRAKERLAILDSLTAGDGPENKQTAIRTATRRQSYNNGLTNFEGKLKGLVDGGLLARKGAAEKELSDYIQGDPERRREYGDVLPSLDALRAEVLKTRDRDVALSDLLAASGLLEAADLVYRYAIEKAKPDAERDSDFQERNVTRLSEKLRRVEKSFDPRADRALLRYSLLPAARLSRDQRLAALDRILGISPDAPETEVAAKVEAFLDRFYRETKLADTPYRVGLLGRSEKELRAIDDPALALAAALFPIGESIRETRKTWEGTESRLMPRYVEALLKKNGGLLAPDANLSLRITYGRVMGVSPRDGLFFTPQTTLSGLMAKHTGKGDFDAPPSMLDAIKASKMGRPSKYRDSTLGDIPVNFLTTVDTTGGSSGSPTLNARGELCGLIFDGTFDTVASDFVFDTERTRSIHVDSRYMLWTMKEVDGASNLLAELGMD